MRVTVLVSRDPGWALTIAGRWQQVGDSVTLVLLDGACTVLRPGHPQAGLLAESAEAGISVVAHDDSLRSRAIRPDRAGAVKIVDLDEIADLVAESADRVMWL